MSSDQYFFSLFWIIVQPVESSLLSFATSLEKPLSQLQTSVANCIFPPKNILLGNEFFLIFHKNLKVTICLELEKSLEVVEVKISTELQKKTSRFTVCWGMVYINKKPVVNSIFPPTNILLGNEFLLIFWKNLKVTICLE